MRDVTRSSFQENGFCFSPPLEILSTAGLKNLHHSILFIYPLSCHWLVKDVPLACLGNMAAAAMELSERQNPLHKEKPDTVPCTRGSLLC